MVKRRSVAHRGWYFMAMSHRHFAVPATEAPPEPTEDDAEVWPEPDVAKSFAALVASTLSPSAALGALAIALIALTLSIVQRVHPPSRGSDSPVFNNQQVKDAKTACMPLT